MTSIPVIKTERLVLRAQTLRDLEELCDLFGSDRARYMGGPIPRKEAWRWLASEVAMWSLMGHGAWAIEDGDGTFLGQVGLLKPPHFPELELGWTLLQRAEGKGYATEAAGAARDWAHERGHTAIVSYIDPANDRSLALARRLGAVPDPQAALPEGETRAETVVYRHPVPEARQ